MNWLLELHKTNPPAHAIAILSLVCVAGMAFGSLRFRGIKLGTSGVLFVAILVGHFSKPIDHVTLEFVKEFGLILFVFCIGLQLGPGFFSSLRQAGLRLNAMALAIVVVGALTAAAMGWLLGLDGAAVLGIFSGATTNTPSLGAAQQTLASFPDVSDERAALPALAYAVTYPLGIVGIIGTLLALKALFRVDVAREVEAYVATERSEVKPLERRTLVVENQNLQGIPIRQVPGLAESGVVVSRVSRKGEAEASTATRETMLQVGDRILAVGPAQGLDHFQRVVGQSSNENLMEIPRALTHRQIVVTNSSAHGTAISELDLDAHYGVTLTRVTRGEIEMTAVPGLRLQFGDVLQAVGPDDGISQAEVQLGNSMQALNETHFIPLFAGIAAGIALGTLPIKVPGLPQPLRLGLAGGPLIVAILVGTIRQDRPACFARAAQCELGFARIWHCPVLRQRWSNGRADLLFDGIQSFGPPVAGRRRVRDHLAASLHWNICPQGIWHELRDALRFDSRKHDRPAGTCLCQRNMPIGSAGGGLCDRLSTDDAAADHGGSNLGCRAVWIMKRAAERREQSEQIHD